MKKTLYLFISIVLTAMSAYAGQYDTKFSGGLSTAISEVATGGYWEQNQSYGTWRIVVRDYGWEHTRSFIYLQWLKTDQGNQKELELKTIPISEFNSGRWHNVMNVEYKNSTF